MLLRRDALAAAGPLAKGKPHPRNFGTFPRVLGHYVREEKVLTLEEAVRKMTSLPADRLAAQSRKDWSSSEVAGPSEPPPAMRTEPVPRLLAR